MGLVRELDLERGVDRTGGRRRAASRPTVTVAVAAVLSIAALAVIVLLTSHATSDRRHDEAIDGVVMQLNALQGDPWRLQASPDTAPSVTALRTHMLATEHQIFQSLSTLRGTAPVAGLSSVIAPLEQNFTMLNRMVDLVARREFAAAGALGPSAFDTHDAAVARLDKAAASYRSEASAALRDVSIGAITAVLLLLGGFTLFSVRAYRAHSASLALADQLESSQTHLEHAQRVAGVGSWEWDPETKSLSFSAEHARLHGWTDPEPPRRFSEVLELVSPEDRERVAEALQLAASGGGPVEFDYRMREAYGGRLIHVHATTFTGQDGHRRMIGTSHDLTERLQRVEAERANQAKNEFISRMSHELRTPLNAVLGFGQLLTMSDLDERQRANVEHILVAGRHLLDLINEILDISRIESGDLRLSPELVRVDSVIGDAIDLVTPIAAPHQISVRTEQGDSELLVHADVQRLRQVLLNLLSNAVKYNRDAGNVQVLASRTGEDRIQIVVEDDGPGIAPEMIDRLFSPFERLGAEQTAVEGTGLGLAVSRGMIEAMGGRITARSEPGKGAAFTIELQAAVDVRARSGDLRIGEAGLV